MLYIVTALKSEAQAFVDIFKLKKEKISNFTIFKNDNITLIVSGIGVENAYLATTTLIKSYQHNEDDIYINIGVCGANLNYKIGQILEIDEISYKEQNYKLKNNPKTKIRCVDIEIDKDIYEIDLW